MGGYAKVLIFSSATFSQGKRSSSLYLCAKELGSDKIKQLVETILILHSSSDVHVINAEQVA